MSTWIIEVAEDFLRGQYLNAAQTLNFIFKKVREDPSFTIAFAIDSFASGVAMLVDDFKDFLDGRFDRPHHWHYGVILIALGLISLGVSLFWILINTA